MLKREINIRFMELDALRGIAAISVVLYHYTVRFHKLYGYSDSIFFKLNYGYLGVELFFIISGFVIFFTLQKSPNRIEFISRRVTRLYPIYWICVTLTFILVNSFGLPGKETSFKELIFNYTMLQYGLAIKSVDGVYWSLFYELIFYTIMVIFINVMKSSKIRVFIISWLTLYLVNQFYHFKYISILLNLEYCVFFISGIYFYKITSGERTSFNKTIPLICYILFFSFNENIFENLIIGCFFILFYLFAFDKLKFIATKPLIFLGSISYVMYLIHQNIGYILLNWLYSNFGFNQLLLIIPLALIVTLSWFITKHVEQPLITFTRNLTKKLSK